MIWIRTAPDKALHLITGVFFLIVLALFVRFNAQYFQAQARYLFPAIGVVAVGVGIGLRTMLSCASLNPFRISPPPTPPHQGVGRGVIGTLTPNPSRKGRGE